MDNFVEKVQAGGKCMQGRQHRRAGRGGRRHFHGHAPGALRIPGKRGDSVEDEDHRLKRGFPHQGRKHL